MNSNIKIFLLCPVPEEQKPINEYIGLKENSLTNWTTLSKRNYQKKIISFFFFLFCFISLIRVQDLQDLQEFFQSLFISDSVGQQTFSFPEPPIFLFFFQWELTNFILVLIFIMFLMIINYIRWKQIQIRFNNPRLFYEEASWYDGQIWEKPFSIIKNDRLVSTQKIQPILDRIVKTICIIFFINLFFLFFFEIF
jgi:hypothetical protein